MLSVAFALFATTPTLTSLAQEPSIPWWKTSAGGGLSHAGQVTLLGTIGQADAGLVSGESVVIYGGFLSYDAAVFPAPTVITWTNIAGGDWADPENWTPNKVPDTTELAVIQAPGNYSVNVDYGAECQALILGGASGVQTVNWSGGQFLGTMLIETNATLNLTGGTLELNGVIENRGRVNWLTPALTLRLEDNARLINRAGGLVDLQGTGWLYSGAAPTRAILNAGTIRKSQNPGPIEVYRGIAFVNAGLVEVQEGTLSLAGLDSSNTVMVASGAVLEMYAGTFNVLPGHQFLGTGKCSFVESTTVNGSLGGDVLYTVSGDVSFDSILKATMWWTNVAMLGNLTIDVQGVLKLSEATQSGVITNYGRIDYTSQGNWGWIISDGAVVEIAPGGLLAVLADMTMNLPTGALFYNRGTVRRSGGTGIASFRGENFINDGTLDFQSGDADFTGRLISRGVINVAQNTELSFEAGNFHFEPNNQFTGTGLCRIAGSTIDGELAGTVDFRIAYDATLNARLNARMVWDYGELSGALTVGNQGILTLAAPGTLAGTITNHGAVFMSGVNSPTWAWQSNARFENATNALFEMQGNGRFHAAGSGMVFKNEGTFRKAQGTAEAMFDPGFNFINSGTLEVLSGELFFGGPYSQTTQGGVVIGIGGPAPVTQYSRIRFQTNAVLAGRFSAVVTGSYRPASGTTFTVLNYPSATGSFNSLNLHLGGGVALTPLFTPTELVLTAVEMPPPSLAFTHISGTLRLIWPDDYTGWQLYSTTNLSTPQWKLVPITNGTAVDLQPDKALEFYQLRPP